MPNLFRCCFPQCCLGYQGPRQGLDHEPANMSVLTLLTDGTPHLCHYTPCLAATTLCLERVREVAMVGWFRISNQAGQAKLQVHHRRGRSWCPWSAHISVLQQKFEHFFLHPRSCSLVHALHFPPAQLLSFDKIDPKRVIHMNSQTVR